MKQWRWWPTIEKLSRDLWKDIVTPDKHLILEALAFIAFIILWFTGMIISSVYFFLKEAFLSITESRKTLKAAFFMSIIAVLVTLTVIRGVGWAPIDKLADMLPGVNLVPDHGTKKYVRQWAGTAIYEMQEHGIPASITLAQGILESGNGESKLTIDGRNHFGIKCGSDWKGAKSHHNDDTAGECFRNYDYDDQSFHDHSLFLKQNPRYASLFKLKPDDYRGWAKGLKDAGYATNNSYAKTLIKLIERYELYKFDRVR